MLPLGEVGEEDGGAKGSYCGSFQGSCGYWEVRKGFEFYKLEERGFWFILEK